MYKYEEMKPSLFTDEGQRMFLKIRDGVRNRLDMAGAVRMLEAIFIAGGGSNWESMACVDRLVELGEIREVAQVGVAGQHRVFVEA